MPSKRAPPQFLAALVGVTYLVRGQLVVPLSFDAHFDPGLETLLGQPRVKYGLAAPALHRDKRDIGPRQLTQAPAIALFSSQEVAQDLGDTLSPILTSSRHDPAWNTATLHAVNVNADNEWSVSLAVGTPPQTLNVIFDTGSTDAFLLTQQCAGCTSNNAPRFDSSRSTSFSNQDSRPFGPVTYADGTTFSGQTGNDTFTLGNLHIEKQLIGLVTSYSGGAQPVLSGIVGLSRYGESLLVQTGAPSIFGNACLQHLLQQPLMGVALVGAGVGNQGGGGQYSFGAIETSYVAGDITYAQVSSTNAWGINITDFTANGLSLLTHGEPLHAVVDTGTSLLFTSDAASRALHALVPGADYDNETQSWTVPCSTSSLTGAPNFFIIIAGVPFGVPAKDLAFQGGWKMGTCLSGVQGGSADYIILGDVFIKNHYIVFDFRSFNIESVRPAIGFANRTDAAPIV